jgi:hypothetical protein
LQAIDSDNGLHRFTVARAVAPPEYKIGVVMQYSKSSSGGIVSQDSFIPVETNAQSRNDLVERGFSWHPLRVDVDVARALEALAHAAWSIPRDKYYDGGDRYRSLNRLRAKVVEGGVRVWPTDESTPYVQLEKYNTTLGGRRREYAPLDQAIVDSVGVRKMIAYHLRSLPLSVMGMEYLINMHVDQIRGCARSAV